MWNGLFVVLRMYIVGWAHIIMLMERTNDVSCATQCVLYISFICGTEDVRDP